MRLFLWALLLILFDVLFWHEKMGVNTLIFSVLLLAVLRFLYAHNSLPTLFLYACTLLTACMITLHASIVAQIAFLVSLGLAMIFSHQPTLRTVHYGLVYLLVALEGTLTGILEWFFSLPTQKNKQFEGKIQIATHYLRLAIIPIIAFIVFLVIFKIANPIFSNLVNDVSEAIAGWVGKFWGVLDIFHLLFWLLAGLWLGMCVYDWQASKFWNLDETLQQENIVRKRYRTNLTLAYPVGVLALRNEFRTGVMLMCMVNALLLVVNIIDIQYIWLGDFASFQNTDLATALHEGTYMLIFSIFLSMAIMLHYFRRNLNFYTQNGWLKWFSYLWIAQNAILVISVALRAYHYILFRGLAYKRIGVLIFLGLTLVGLITLFFKIKDSKASYFLLKTNGWAVYVMLVLMSLIDWDMLIVQYNIAHYKNLPAKRKEIDMEFLLGRADKTLRLIFKNQKDLPLTNQDSFLMKNRISEFLENHKSYTWASWNYEEAITSTYLQTSK